jgi:hypothetical protein
MHKYGREFSAAVMENRDGCVSERVRTQGDVKFFNTPTQIHVIGDEENFRQHAF